jgi:dTDP-4-amino-4,6-dideoxygalactose transaminase
MQPSTATPEALDLAALERRARRDEFLSFAPPAIGGEESREVLDCLASGWLTTGPRTQQFEKDFAAYCGAAHAVAVSSCTAAMHLALVALGIGPGDEVIVPTYTFASTAHAVLYVGARPVFVDSDPATFNLDPARVAEAVTPRTRAIMPVHYAGRPCDMAALDALAARHGLAVVEDAAHAAGAAIAGAPIGSRANPSCFSFYSTKNMTTAEGGMITLADGDMAERLRVLAMYGISDARRIWANRYGGEGAPPASWVYDVQMLGFKYNMTDIQAALGIHQLRKLDGFIERRAHFAALYTAGLGDLEAIAVPAAPDGVRHAWHLFSILLRPEVMNIDRDGFMEELKAENVGASVLFRPLHLHSLYQQRLGCRDGDFPIAEDLYRRTLSLPMSPRMSDDDLLDAISAVRRIVARHSR